VTVVLEKASPETGTHPAPEKWCFIFQYIRWKRSKLSTSWYVGHRRQKPCIKVYGYPSLLVTYNQGLFASCLSFSSHQRFRRSLKLKVAWFWKCCFRSLRNVLNF